MGRYSANPPEVASLGPVRRYHCLMGGQALPEWDRTQLVCVEYTHLRGEIIKLVELQFQLTGLCVIALGTMLSLGFERGNAAIILTYPIVALALGVNWLHHTFRIHRIADYIRSEIEQEVGTRNLGWEHYVRATPLPVGPTGYWGLRAVFIVSPVLSVAAALTLATYTASTVVLLAVAVVATVATIVFFSVWREPAPELLGPIV
jgi:hypothetical protein